LSRIREELLMPIKTTDKPIQQLGAFAVPEKVGAYEVLEKLGEGSMGSVYKGRHTSTGELVAIKILAPEIARSQVLVQRFQQEFRAAHDLCHPNIVRCYEFGLTFASSYLVMEFVDGPSLGERIARLGRLTEEEAVRVVCQVAEGLHLAHENNIIHRDVKPDNILLTSQGQAKLTDLGLAKNRASALELTLPRSGLGTPNFMAPEQFGDAKNADVLCDVYSLGATLYMAITGELPFRARSTLHTLKKKMRNELTAPIELVPTLNEQTDHAIRQALRADPQQRQADCLRFIASLTGGSSLSRAPQGQRITQPISLWPPFGKPPVVKERRVAVRYASGLETSCRPSGRVKEHTWLAVVQDISATGIGLLLNRRFEPGAILLVELQVEGQGCRSTVLCRVVRLTKQAARKWSVGCTFVRRLGEGELKILLERTKPAS
jgi:serine/threonine protein kinase